MPFILVFEWGKQHTDGIEVSKTHKVCIPKFIPFFLVYFFFYGSFSPPYYKCYGYKYIEVLNKVLVGLLASLLWISYNHNILQLYTGCCS